MLDRELGGAGRNAGAVGGIEAGGREVFHVLYRATFPGNLLRKRGLLLAKACGDADWLRR